MRQIRVYRDPLSGYVLHVAPDGRHLEAVDARGHLVWYRDPHSGVFPYRHEPACIDTLGPDGYQAGRITNRPFKLFGADGKMRTLQEGRTGHYVYLVFDNSQQGIVNVWTGEFIFFGQN